MVLISEFKYGVASKASLPRESIPEIVFAGRSNCGKSSMINAIFRRKKLARVSSNPGCTRQINFYAVENNKFMAVDLPGYGYAKLSKAKILSYSALIEAYFLRNKVIKNVFVLMDSKVGMKDSDFQFCEWLLSLKINFSIVLTKIDKVAADHIDNICIDIEKLLESIGCNPVFFYRVSALRKIGTGVLARDMVKLATK